MGAKPPTQSLSGTEPQHSGTDAKGGKDKGRRAELAHWCQVSSRVCRGDSEKQRPSTCPGQQ